MCVAGLSVWHYCSRLYGSRNQQSRCGCGGGPLDDPRLEVSLASVIGQCVKNGRILLAKLDMMAHGNEDIEGLLDKKKNDSIGGSVITGLGGITE